METRLVYKLIQYRNGYYQGTTSDAHPQGLGLFLDDRSVLYSSIWNEGYPNQRTAVFLSRQGYIFGEWRQGKPHGFNVFRSEDVVLIGNYEQGKIKGKSMVIFEKSNHAVVMGEGEKGKSGGKVVQKRAFSSNLEQKEMIKKQFPQLKDPEEYIQLVTFLKGSFCQGNEMVRIGFEKGELKFGFEEGLGVVFSNEKVVEKVGMMDKERRMNGLGATYGADISQEGDFENREIAKYRGGSRPSKEIKAIYSSHHKKSIVFKNDFIVMKSEELGQYLNDTLGYHLANIPVEDMNEIRKKNRNLQEQLDGRYQDLRSIKEDVEKSVGKNTYMNKSPSKQGVSKHHQPVHIPVNRHVGTEEIQFVDPKTNTPEKNRRIFMENNHLNDYRDKEHLRSGNRTFYDITHSYKPKHASPSPNLSKKKSRPILSRDYISPEPKEKSRVIEMRKITEKYSREPIQKQEVYSPKRIDVSSIKYKNTNSMEVSKKSEHPYEKDIQLEEKKERERELRRFNNHKLSESIQKEISELSRIEKLEPNRIKQSPELKFDLKRGSHEEETAAKGIREKVRLEKQEFRESPVDRIKDEMDSHGARESKIYESRYRRYMEDQDLGESDHQREERYLPKKNLSPTSVLQMTVSESRQKPPIKSTEIERQEYHYNERNHLERQLKSRRVQNQEQPNSRYNHPDPTQHPSDHRHPKQSRTKKIIEIEHQRISPGGKKTTTFERIVKKYQYITETG